MKNSIVKIISTFFYTGYLPLMPGTFGSLAGILVYWYTKDNLTVYTVTLGVLIAVGFLVGGNAEKLFKKKDASCIVIDEVAGMLLSLWLVPFNIVVMIFGFAVFRTFDIVKPFPARKLQSLKAGAGIMSDDLIAGVYTNFVLQLLSRLISFKGA